MIVCLGWGSLIWRPEDLPLVDNRPEAWRADGPELPVEFLRVSSNGCLTLVVDESSPDVPVLWNQLSVNTMPEAIEALRLREGDTRRSWIGSWPNDSIFEGGRNVERWARSRSFEGVVWTAIPAKFDSTDHRRPTQAEALNYLLGLSGNVRTRAEEYVRRAPCRSTHLIAAHLLSVLDGHQFDDSV